MRRGCEQFGSARRAIIALLGAMALLALSPAASSAAVNFNVKGKWTCSNRGVVIPLNGARAELWHEISYWPDDKVGSQRTAADGSYNFGVHASSNVTLYVKLVLNDDRGVKLGDWYSFSDWDTQTNTVGSHSGTVNLGTWQISKDSGRGTPKCAIWQGAHNAYTDYKQVIGANPPAGHYSISADFPCCGTPFTTTDTTRWPGGYQTGNGTGDPGGPFSVNFHEFAHSVRHSFDGDTLHFLGDVARYSYPQTHTACKLTNTGFAFNEGWAEYWAHTAHSCPDPTNLSQEATSPQSSWDWRGAPTARPWFASCARAAERSTATPSSAPGSSPSSARGRASRRRSRAWKGSRTPSPPSSSPRTCRRRSLLRTA